MAKPNCSKCGAVKVGCYRAESWCGKCIGERRKELRAKKRAEKGLPPYGSGRDPLCKICRKPKEERYFDGSYCASCKLERLQKHYYKKRSEKGLTPRRKGRNPICKCGTKKENKSEAFCRKCHNESKRLLRLKNKRNPDWVKQEREKNIARYRDNLDQMLKRMCRDETRRAVRKGILMISPCEVCGEEDAQAHHDDYTKPLEVRWLCSWHHAQLHKELKTKDG